MIDALIPIISGVVSATVQISYAIHQWWQNKKDKRVQNVAFQASQPTSQAAKELQSVMEVQRAFWQSNPGMWQALGRDAARAVESSYSNSNGYLGQLAQIAVNAPDGMDWRGSSSGIRDVSYRLRQMFAIHLGKVISKMVCRPVLSIFIPKETKEAMARENARLLMQAQSDLNLLAVQMAASEEGTRRQIEWYQQQQEQQVHGNAPQLAPRQVHPNTYQSNPPPTYTVMDDQSDGNCIIS